MFLHLILFCFLTESIPPPQSAFVQMLGAKYSNKYKPDGSCYFSNCNEDVFDVHFQMSTSFSDKNISYYNDYGQIKKELTLYHKVNKVSIQSGSGELTHVTQLVTADGQNKIIFHSAYTGYYYNARGPFYYGPVYTTPDFSLYHLMSPICPAFSGPNCQKWCPYDQRYECDIYTGLKYCINKLYGENCDSSLQPCSSNPCKNLHKCENVGNTFKCSCLGNFIGDLCQNVRCTLETCGQGICESETCMCERGYGGVACNDVICNAALCNNKGICATSVDKSSFYCDCERNFMGRYCEYSCSAGCFNGGKCIVMNNRAVCECKAPYTGLKCHIKTILNDCPENYCKNGGTCNYDRVTAHVSCDCNRYWTGSTCEISTCDPQTCTKGICMVEFGCMCFDGYAGSNCDIVSAISCQMCVTPSTCEAEGDNVYCKCNAKIQTGEFCEHICTPKCVHGTCQMENGLVKCVCEDEYEGPDCNTRKITSMCQLDPCKNGGQCHPIEKTDYNCICSESYTGKNCELSTCLTQSCVNGVCLLGYGCICADNYNGVNCSIPTCDATQKYCINQGVCKISGNMISCDCPSATTGDRCEFKCKKTCTINGICSVIDGKTGCKCEVGFYGERCENTSEFAYFELLYKVLAAFFPIFLIGIVTMSLLTRKHKNMVENKAMENAMFDTSKLLKKPKEIISNLKEDVYGKFLNFRKKKV